MIGLDTNVVLRYLLKDDLQQAEKARRLIENCLTRGEDCFIGHVVLCETIWVMQRGYRLAKPEIIEAIETLLETKGLIIDAEDTVEEALAAYRIHPVSFPDAFIAVAHRRAGVAHTFTFDKKAAALPGFKVLK